MYVSGEYAYCCPGTYIVSCCTGFIPTLVPLMLWCWATINLEWDCRRDKIGIARHNWGEHEHAHVGMETRLRLLPVALVTCM